MPPCAPMPTPPATPPGPICPGKAPRWPAPGPAGPLCPTPYCACVCAPPIAGKPPGPGGAPPALNAFCPFSMAPACQPAPSRQPPPAGSLFFFFRCVYRAGSRRTARPSTRGAAKTLCDGEGKGGRSARAGKGRRWRGGRRARRTRETADRPLSTRAATIARCHPEAARPSTPSTRDGDTERAWGREDVAGIASNDDVDRKPPRSRVRGRGPRGSPDRTTRANFASPDAPREKSVFGGSPDSGTHLRFLSVY